MSSPSGIAAGKGRGNPCRHSLSSWNWYAPAPPSQHRNCLFQLPERGIMSVVAVVGLGYVGLPLAVEFEKR